MFAYFETKFIRMKLSYSKEDFLFKRLLVVIKGLLRSICNYANIRPTVRYNTRKLPLTSKNKLIFSKTIKCDHFL